MSQPQNRQAVPQLWRHFIDLVGMGMPEEDAHSREVKCALQVAVEVIRSHLPASSFSLSLHPSAVTTSA